MKAIRAVGSFVVLCGLAATMGCQQTAEGMKKDAAANAEKAEKAAAEAAKAATEAAKEAGKAMAESAQDAAQKAVDATAAKAAEASKDAGAAVEAAAETLDVKAALMADRSIDAGRINVDTDAKTRTVFLKGSVPTAQQKAAAEKLAIAKAAGYTVVNQLVVAPGK